MTHYQSKFLIDLLDGKKLVNGYHEGAQKYGLIVKASSNMRLIGSVQKHRIATTVRNSIF